MKIPARLKLLASGFMLLGFALGFFFLVARSAHASQNLPVQKESNSAASGVFNTNPDVPKNFHSVVQIVLIESLSAVVCQLAGVDPLNSYQKCLGVDPKSGKIGFVDSGGGLITVMGRLIDYTLAPPASSTQYVAYLKSNFGVTKSAYAQTSTCATANNDRTRRGVGFCSILPILDLWVAMRNIVYLILILAFIVIGLGIMLRIHIDPRTVMTVQNQIPRIIVGIVVITFSFAIAGFLIDVMWIAVYLFAGVIASTTGTSTNAFFNIVQGGTPFDAAGSAFNGGIAGIAGDTSKAFSDLIVSVFNGRGGLELFWNLLGGLINIVAFLVIFIAILVSLLRLWVSLVITYINVLLDIVFAPFWILAGIMPGSSLGIGAWFRDLLANLAVFPVALSFFILANYFVNAFEQGSAGLGSNDVVVPPLLGGTNQAAISALIGLGFILMLPNLLSTVKAALKAPKLNFGPIFAPVQSSAGQLTSLPRRGTQIAELEGRRRYAATSPSWKTRAYRVFQNPYMRDGSGRH